MHVHINIFVFNNYLDTYTRIYTYLKENILKHRALFRYERFSSESRTDIEISVVTQGILL